MSILHIRRTVRFEVQHSIPRENNGFRRVNIDESVSHGANAHKVGYITFFLFRKLRRTLRNLFVGSFNRFVENRVKSDVPTSATGHFIAWKSDEIVGEVNEVVSVFGVA